jgi:uncharacterized protein (UPF0335 family)
MSNSHGFLVNIIKNVIFLKKLTFLDKNNKKSHILNKITCKLARPVFQQVKLNKLI